MQTSALPQSFDGNGFLYMTALWAIMAIACLGLSVMVWMLRDTWRDRYRIHPKSLLFFYRTMVGLAAFAAFARSFPEAIYLQMYGENDVSQDFMMLVLQIKRFMDSTSIAWVAGWMGLHAAMYPFMQIALTQGPAKELTIDMLSPWHRMVRPAIVMLLIGAVSALMAYSKVYGAH